VILIKKNMKKITKKGMQFSWIFAVIVGAIILFLAFYFIGSQLSTSKLEEKTVETNSLEILFNPFSYLGAMGAVTAKPIEIPQESFLMFECESVSSNGLGSDIITLSSLNLQDQGLPKYIYDKYIFAEDFEAKKTDGKYPKLQTLSKPFLMPWRVADLIFVYPNSKKYCFTGNIPSRLQEELEFLEITNLRLDSCEPEDIEVCFGSSRGDINVESYSGDFMIGSVRKNSDELFFAGENYALMLAAIFSSEEVYNCNLKRLAARIDLEIDIFNKKKQALSEKGCSSFVNFERLRQAATDLRMRINQDSIREFYNAAESVKSSNENSECHIF